MPPLQTIQTDTSAPTDTLPTETAPDQTDDPSGGDEPELTLWPEPASVAYGGSYLDIARDGNASAYPQLTVSKQVQITLLNMTITFKIPSSWSIEDPDGTPTFVDDKGREVGQVYQVNAYMTEPYFSLNQQNATPIAWETPGPYKYDARALTLESDNPTASTAEKKTIIRIVGVIPSEAYTDEDGKDYYMTLCLSFDKAYVNGSSVDYVVSNKTIDEITKSFADGLDLDE
jgi:hypothetical protein